ncbi:glycosyl transferase [Planctomycetota bacterium]|nr:glycosyl transferase [Planctomycetota bacterium]
MTVHDLPRLSLIVPCCNEAEVLSTTHARLLSVLESTGKTWEILYIDDGSHDRTWVLIGSFAAPDPRIRGLRLSRNFGHQRAVSAGLDAARGQVVVIIDADLQDPPELIPAMLDRWRQGADVVYGQRRTRAGETGFKIATARLFYRFLDRLSDVRIPLDTGDFRLMDRTVVEAVKAMPERDRFLRGMVAWAGFAQEALPYDRDSRAAGVTKYPLSRMIAFAADALFSFSVIPLRFATWMGFATSGLAALLIVYALAMRVVVNHWVEGWTLLIIAVSFFGGVQLICLGIIGEYLGRTYHEAKRRPLYVVRADTAQPSPSPRSER